MKPTKSQQQATEPVDEVTKAAIEQAQAEVWRGETVTLEEARNLVRKRYQAWRKAQQGVFAA